MPMIARTAIGWRHAVRRFGEERQAETQDAVGAELQHDAGENHGAGRGRFGMRVRQPGVQREQRNLDRERQEERAEEQQLGARREGELSRLHQAQDVRQVERAGLAIEPQDGDQHQDRAEHRVQNEFHGGVDAALVAPHADHEIHGDQRQFPEDEEQEEVERNENADHGRLDHQQRDEEAFHIFTDRFPGAENGDRREERGQQDEKEADAVHAQVVMNRVADPSAIFGELISGVRRAEATQQEQRNREFGEGSRERNPADPDVIVRAQHE